MKAINSRVKVLSRLALLAAGLSVSAQTLVEVRIEGKVTDPYGSPVKAAEVKATLGKGEHAKKTVTDANGAFSLVVDRPGAYSVEATATDYESAPFSRNPRLIRVQPKDGLSGYKFDFVLHKPSIVRGRLVHGDTGEPIASLQLRLLASVYRRGHRTLFPVGSGATDPSGAFRIASVAPGDYFLELQPSTVEHIRPVSAKLNGAQTDGGRTSGYRRQFLPDHVEPDSAVPMHVYSGSDVNLGTMEVRREQYVRVFVRTQFSDCHGEPSSVVLFQRFGDSTATRATATLPCDSPFVIDSVGRGAFRLAAWIQGRQQFEREIVDIPIVVSEHDVDVMVTAAKPLPLTGRVEIPEAASKALLSHIKVWLLPLGGLDLGSPPASVANDASFTLPLLHEGSAQIVVEGLDRPWYVRDIVYNGSSLRGSILPVEPAASTHHIEVIVSDSPSTLQGRVTEKGAPVTAGQVLIARWPLVLKEGYPEFESCKLDESGEFVQSGLSPGTYHVLVVRDHDQLRIEESEYAIALLSSAKEISLGDGVTVSTTLEVDGR